MRKLALSRNLVDQSLVERAIQQANSKLLSLSPVHIFLFGSAAEGRVMDDSDLDFLLVFSDQQSLRSAQLNHGQLLPLCDFSTDLVWLTLEEFDRKKNLGGVAYTAFNEGRLLYSGAPKSLQPS